MAHKAVLGSTFLGLAAIVGGAGTIYGRPDFLMHAAFLALVGTTLAGAGMAKSDQFYRDRSAVLETGVDRRAPRSGATIPPTDLRKLEAKADPSKGDK
jgi:hypothetical protein